MEDISVFDFLRDLDCDAVCAYVAGMRAGEVLCSDKRSDS